MNIEELESLIANEDAEGLVRAVATLGEKERRALGKCAVELSASLVRKPNDPGHSTRKNREHMPERLAQHLSPANRSKRPQDELVHMWSVAQLAILALGSKQEALKAQWPSYLKAWQPMVAKILTDRKPEWAGAWLAAQLESWKLSPSYPSTAGSGFWDVVEPLLNSKTCVVPDVDGYFILLPYVEFERLVQRPPFLAQEFWRLFERDTAAFHASDGHGYRSEDWVPKVVALAEQNVIERTRLIASILRALTSDIDRTKTIAGFIRLHDALALTVDELQSNLGSYLGLLGGRLPQVATFALAVLRMLQKQKKLDGARFLKAASAAFMFSTKVQPLTTLKLVADVVKTQPKLCTLGAEVAAQGLLHAEKDVQEAALDALEPWWGEASETARASAVAAQSNLAASLRDRLLQLTSTSGAPFDSGAKVKKASTVPAPSTPATGKSGAAQQSETLPFALWRDPRTIAVLDAAKAITPVKDAEELIDLVSQCLSHVEDSADVERVLDGLSRLGTEKPASFSARTSSIAKRLEKSAKSKKSFVTFFYADEAWLLRVWLGQAPEKPGDGGSHVIPFLGRRIDELGRRMLRGIAAPLLATPTHEGGWIDPNTLVQRVKQLQVKGESPPPFDFSQALLRLAPDGREAARKEAAKIEGTPGRALRWALGADAAPTAADTADAMVWVAAGRARSPYGGLPELALVGMDASDPDVIESATYAWQTGVDHYKRPCILVTTTPSGFSKKAHVAPTASFLKTDNYDYNAGWMNTWLTTAWPLKRDAIFAMAARSMSKRLDRPVSEDSPNAELLAPLGHPTQPWPEVAYLAVGLGLSGKDADAALMATTVLSKALGESRAHPEPFARILGPLIAEGFVAAARVAPHLALLAKESSLHQLFVCEAVESLVMQSLSRDVTKLLDVLLEGLTLLGRTLSAATSQALAAAKLTGKPAKTAKALMDLKASPKARTEQAFETARAARDALLLRWGSP